MEKNNFERLMKAFFLISLFITLAAFFADRQN